MVEYTGNLLDRYTKGAALQGAAPSDIRSKEDAEAEYGADVVQRGYKAWSDVETARSEVANPAAHFKTRDEAILKLHDAVVAAQAVARSGNRYLLDHANRFPAEYGFLNDGFDEDSEVIAYEHAISVFGEQNVTVVNEILHEIDSLHQILDEAERAEPSFDDETGSYSYSSNEGDAQELETLRVNIERQIDAAWQRVTALHSEGNGYVEQAAQTNAELFARVIEKTNAWNEFQSLRAAGHEGAAVPQEAFGNELLLGYYQTGLEELESDLKNADQEISLDRDRTATHPTTGWSKEISDAQWENLAVRKSELESARDKIPGTIDNPIQIGHTAEQQLRYALSAAPASPQPIAEGESMKTPDPVPGTIENPIQLGHTIEQQLKYAVRGKPEAARERRTIFNAKPDSVEMFRELYQDVVRTGESFPIGALERHAEGRLQQTYAALVLIENAKAAGIIPENSKFVATGAKVQDKRASKEYPAAHRLPADLSIEASDGSRRRLTDYLDVDLDRIWVDQNIFAPTDRIHRLANVADQWVEDGGMKTAFVAAANAVSSGKMTAEEALEDIVEPGYAAANARALEKVERNFSLIERQALSQRVVDQHGQPYRKVPEPTVLKIKGLDERAAAKDVMERTLKAYSRMEELSPSLRMKSNLAVNGIIDNEIRLREQGPNARRVLAPGEAMVEARRAAGDANTALTKQMDEVIQLGNKASAAAAAAADPSRPLEARMRAMGDAGAYGEAMKTAWAKLQGETGPKVVKGLSDRLERCGPHAGGHLAAVTARLASPPKEVLQAAHQIDDAQEKLQRANRSQVESGQQNSVRPSIGQRPSPSME
ncbi:hypothetical protein [Agrobacterium tumefaciens]|uniref:hypothetical protein n=1 Tax=Agrobacterium tumefaciens TaxID=358 RepID=UPI0015727C23|nr:hypothetical protein [Agrobacterium tumefaciens]NSX94393.1 hypothetical protein [Agrobacterium tumefaciens]